MDYQNLDHIDSDSRFYTEFNNYSSQDYIEALPSFVAIEVLRSRMRVVVDQWVKQTMLLPTWKKKLFFFKKPSLLRYFEGKNPNVGQTINDWTDTVLENLKQLSLDGNYNSWNIVLKEIHSLFTFFGTIPPELNRLIQVQNKNDVDYKIGENSRDTSIREGIINFLQKSGINEVASPRPFKQYVFMGSDNSVFIGKYDDQGHIELSNLPSKLSVDFSITVPEKVKSEFVLFEFEDLFPQKAEFSTEDLYNFARHEAAEPRIHTTYGPNFFAIIQEGVLASTDRGSVENSPGVFVAPFELVVENGEKKYTAEYYSPGSVVFLFDIKKESLNYVNGYEVISGPVDFTHPALRKVILPNRKFRQLLLTMVETMTDDKRIGVFGFRNVSEFLVVAPKGL